MVVPLKCPKCRSNHVSIIYSDFISGIILTICWDCEYQWVNDVYLKIVEKEMHISECPFCKASIQVDFSDTSLQNIHCGNCGGIV